MFSTSIRAARKRNESGIALVLTAVFMIAFCGLVAFGVDLGYWYLQAERLQRAADNSALAVATAMPANDATSKGLETAKRNGYDDEGSTSVVVKTDGTRATVTVKDMNVATFFAKFFLSSLSISRTATAEKSTALPMGSPYNVIGTGNLTLPMKGGGDFPKANTWLAINGPCSAREDGDYFMSKYIGNKGADETKCPGVTANPAYDLNGYSYYVEVPPAQKGAVNIRLYDPAFNPDGNVTSPDGDLTQPLDIPGSQDISFWLWQINPNGSETLVEQVGFGPSGMEHAGKWVDFATIPAADVGAARSYRIQVAARDSELTNDTAQTSYSVNAFSIWADAGDGKVCDSRVDNSCPQVFGKTAVSLLNNVSEGSDNKASFMLAGMPVTFSGTKASVSIFDPGEGVQAIEVLMPNGNLATFDWESFPKDVGYSGTGVTSVDVSGFGPQPYGGGAADPGTNFKFNDRRIVITLNVPEDPDQWLGANGNNWWQIQYIVKPGTKPSPDRTTWGADLGGDGPAHLVRN